jgi:membrane associated rhomboid family serine protease
MYRDSGFGFSFSVTPMVKKLLVANAAVFLLTLVIGEGRLFDWFALQPGRILVRPWGIGTYMFLHAGVWHILMNMLVLFFFGPPLEARWGEREFLRFYLVGGLGGAALSFLFMPQMVVGASAAIYAVMLAFALNWPNAPIYIYGIFPVKAKWLVGFLFVLTVLGTFGSSGSGTAHFAHLGGILAAFAYLKADWRPGSALARIRRNVPGAAGGKSGSRSPRPLAIVPRELQDQQTESGTREERPAAPADERKLLDEVDRVLDKISAQGMSSLTSEERRLLDEVSRRRRMN